MKDKSGDKDKKKDEPVKSKEDEGKLMVDEDDKKEDLNYETIWKTMHMAGGPLAWLFIIISFFATSSY